MEKTIFMTAKEKAIELVKKFEIVESSHGIHTMWDDMPHLCALIAVDEILNSEPRSPSDVDWDDAGGTHQYYYEAERECANKYWQEVKQEIEKL